MAKTFQFDLKFRIMAQYSIRFDSIQNEDIALSIATRFVVVLSISLCTVCFGQHSFHSSTPSVWNDHPSKLKNSDISTQGFKSCVKSWLFEHAYS